MLPSPGPVTGSTTSQPLFYNQATTAKAASSQPPTSIPQDRRAVSLLPLLAHRPHLPGSNRPCSRATTHHHNRRYRPHSSEHRRHRELRLSFGPQNHRVAHTQCGIQPKVGFIDRAYLCIREGTKSEDDSRLASRKYACIIQKLGFNAKFSEFKIQNIVGSCDAKFPIQLVGLAYSHGQLSSYEPEVRISHVRCLPLVLSTHL